MITASEKKYQNFCILLTHLLNMAIPLLDLTSLGSIPDLWGTLTTPTKLLELRGFTSRLTSNKGVPFTWSLQGTLRTLVNVE